MAQQLKNGATMLGPDTVNPYESTQRVTYQGIEYVIGPNMIVGFADNGIAAAVDAFSGDNTNLRPADSRDKNGANTQT